MSAPRRQLVWGIGDDVGTGNDRVMVRPQPKVTCLVTIHGIGFQEPADDARGPSRLGSRAKPLDDVLGSRERDPGLFVGPTLHARESKRTSG